MIRAATRGSALARWQADHVAALLGHNEAGPAEALIVSTAGDRDKVTPLHEIGGKGVFVKEVQAAVLDGRADIAVHSAKDLPALTPEGLTICGLQARQGSYVGYHLLPSNHAVWQNGFGPSALEEKTPSLASHV